MVTTQALSNVFDHFDRNLLTPYAIGFDGVFDRLNHYIVNQNSGTPQGFPPYNIRKDGDYHYVIEMALAGLSKDDLEVEVDYTIVGETLVQTVDFLLERT